MSIINSETRAKVQTGLYIRTERSKYTFYGSFSAILYQNLRIIQINALYACISRSCGAQLVVLARSDQ